MPYIAIKAYPKDKETQKRVAERIQQVFLEEWGCPAQAISISMESVDPALWNEQIVKEEMEPNRDKMLIWCGEQQGQ
ncbi:MAG: hypothetical protein IKU10_05480 [Clostridia bacterium]|nr:hypothetical protein [Clostridia bacterium]